MYHAAHRGMLAQHSAIFRQPSILRNFDLPVRHEAKQQDPGGMFTRRRALRLDPPAAATIHQLDQREAALGAHYRR